MAKARKSHPNTRARGEFSIPEAVHKIAGGLFEAIGGPYWVRSPYFWCIAIRMIFMLTVDRFMQGDAIDYEQLAINLASGKGFTRCFFEPYMPTSQRPPLYSMVLALVYLLGATHGTGAIYLNLACDLVSMKLVRIWCKDLRLTWANYSPWVIALCPILITYGMYPTTENLSITLFFASIILMFRQAPVSAGLMWGLLSLCRSYYLLFPVVLFFSFRKLRLVKQMTVRAFAVMMALSFVAPSAWMVRNYITLDRIAFTQTSMVGWQSYQGLCIANFDWWRPDHLGHMYSVPILAAMIRGHCAKEEEMAALDQQVKGLVETCVTERPLDVIRNVFTKGIMLFVNWGLFMPYNRVPFMLQNVINAFMFFYWYCMIRVLWRARARVRGGGAFGEVVRFSLLNIAYIVAVTLPFSVDARYLLGPFLTLTIAVFEVVRTPGALADAGLER